MTRSEKAERIHKILDELYPEPAIPLEHQDPFTLLIAVVLSAQCTDVRVNQVTPRLFERAKTPAQMAALTPAEIEAIIRPCGLAPAKARNIPALSEILLREHAADVPQSFAALEALPGVGHKTASVVLCQAFGQPAFAVDTHIHRLAARWGLSRAKNVVQTEDDLKQLFAPEHWARLHLQIIYFGREHCPALRHDLEHCPICSWAASRARIDREMGAQKKRVTRSVTKRSRR